MWKVSSKFDLGEKQAAEKLIWLPQCLSRKGSTVENFCNANVSEGGLLAWNARLFSNRLGLKLTSFAVISYFLVCLLTDEMTAYVDTIHLGPVRLKLVL